MLTWCSAAKPDEFHKTCCRLGAKVPAVFICHLANFAAVLLLCMMVIASFAHFRIICCLVKDIVCVQYGGNHEFVRVLGSSSLCCVLLAVGHFAGSATSCIALC